MRLGDIARFDVPKSGDVTTPLKSVRLTRLRMFSALILKMRYGPD